MWGLGKVFLFVFVVGLVGYVVCLVGGYGLVLWFCVGWHVGTGGF